MALRSMTAHTRLEICNVVLVSCTLRPVGCVLSCKNYSSCPPPPQGCGLADKHQLILMRKTFRLSFGVPSETDGVLNPGPGECKAGALPLSYPHIPKRENISQIIWQPSVPVQMKLKTHAISNHTENDELTFNVFFCIIL